MFLWARCLCSCLCDSDQLFIGIGPPTTVQTKTADNGGSVCRRGCLGRTLATSVHCPASGTLVAVGSANGHCARGPFSFRPSMGAPASTGRERRSGEQAGGGRSLFRLQNCGIASENVRAVKQQAVHPSAKGVDPLVLDPRSEQVNEIPCAAEGGRRISFVHQ